jgi:hypothetical protein
MHIYMSNLTESENDRVGDEVCRLIAAANWPRLQEMSLSQQLVT